MRVKIVRPPDGNSPFKVRKALVGLVLQAHIPPSDARIFDGRTATEGNYVDFGGVSVDVVEMLRVLRDKAPGAATWYLTYLPPIRNLHLLPDEYVIMH